MCVNKPARATRGQSCGPPPYGSGCDVGLYCDGETTKCLPQKNGGQKCGLYDEQCLSGSCVQVTSRPRVNVCLSLQKVGEKCTADKQCAGFSSGDSLCNIPRGSTGTCVRIVKLLTALGEACSPINDHCDARRGLSCRWGGNGLKFVCAQRASDDDNGISNRYCTSGADRRLSSCKPSKGLPTECRKGDNLFPKCLPKTEIVQQGKICTAEGLRPVCAPGLTCSSSDAVFEERGSSKVTKYCAKLVDEGETCDRIGTQCSGPLECVDGTCTNVPYRPTSLAEDYAQLGAVYNGFQLFCGDTDCAPGLECNDSYCEVSVVPAKKGDNCFKTAGFAKVCNVTSIYATITRFFFLISPF